MFEDMCRESDRKIGEEKIRGRDEKEERERERETERERERERINEGGRGGRESD